ncbi:amidohydrolase [Propionispira arboris]|uniref:Peptidase M20 domain-containing protein 2 n=1 Tax=Propionispira arboris TaxID=84035 RepID=A0A1H7B8S4_9FIRM|nr:amidohydrolase [Propionispira arboris]SEJ74123.1 amidohydrolase [Propionispira arboris]
MQNLLKQKVCEAIYAHKEEIITLANSIANEPELGFKEIKTSQKITDLFEKYEIPYTRGHAITGVKAHLQGKSSKRKIAILGEMDAIICHDHPMSNMETGAAHACGHNVQMAILAACAIGLKTSGVMQALDGDVIPFAVPAEEYVEIEYRNRLKEQGKLKYFGGKSELIRCGDFDDIDMAMMMHVSMQGEEKRRIDVGGTSNGFIGKMIRFKGKEAHAGSAPHEGINALNAALIALTAVNAQRETFRDEDCVRFHPIITKGGDLVNVVPAEVCMESYVRAKTVKAMMDANQKVNRALKGGAMAIGAEVEINDMPGFLPMINNSALTTIYEKNVLELLGEDSIEHLGHSSGSTDMGDLSHIMPVIHPWFGGGTKGTVHTREFAVTDDEMAYLLPAITMAATIIDLLTNQAEQAEEILQDYQPEMTKEAYLQFMESIH